MREKWDFDGIYKSILFTLTFTANLQTYSSLCEKEKYIYIYQPSHSYLRDATQRLPKCNIYILLTVTVQACLSLSIIFCSYTYQLSAQCFQSIQCWIECNKRFLCAIALFRVHYQKNSNTFRHIVPPRTAVDYRELLTGTSPSADKCSRNIEVTPHVLTCEALLTYLSTWLKKININHN